MTPAIRKAAQRVPESHCSHIPDHAPERGPTGAYLVGQSRRPHTDRAGQLSFARSSSSKNAVTDGVADQFRLSLASDAYGRMKRPPMGGTPAVPLVEVGSQNFVVRKTSLDAVGYMRGSSQPVRLGPPSSTSTPLLVASPRRSRLWQSHIGGTHNRRGGVYISVKSTHWIASRAVRPWAPLISREIELARCPPWGTQAKGGARPKPVHRRWSSRDTEVTVASAA